MSHQIKLEDLISFQAKTVIAGSFGKGENKSLVIVTKITIMGELDSQFIVREKDTILFTSTNLQEAISAYNSIS